MLFFSWGNYNFFTIASLVEAQNTRMALLEGVSLTISTLIEPPFVMEATDGRSDSGKHGYIVDLLEALKEKLGFNYTLYLVPDGSYGAKTGAGAWTGLVGEVFQGRADISAAALTINSERYKGISFSAPFMQSDFGLIHKKRSDDVTLWFFLQPFSFKVWLVILASLLIMATILYFYSKFQSEPVLESVSGCLHFGIACILAQGPETYPKSLPCRVVAVSWWFFCLTIFTLYTASLTSIMTLNRAHVSINSIEDLLSSTQFAFGVQDGTVSQQLFMRSTYPPFQMLWAEIVRNREPIATAQQGYSRVRSEDNFALIAELPFLEYEVGIAPCNLRLVRSPHSPTTGSGYGLAFPKDSPLVTNFSVAVLQLAMDGTLSRFHKKYFKDAAQCKHVSFEIPQQVFTFRSIRGIVFIFSVGILTSYVLSLAKIAFRKLVICKTKQRDQSTTNKQVTQPVPNAESVQTEPDQTKPTAKS